MKPKKGSSLTPVSPAAPAAAESADEADPGLVAAIKAAQAKVKAGKYGSTPAKPFKPAPEPKPGEKQESAAATEEAAEEKAESWIEIEMVDMDDQPVPGEAYEITLPDGETVASGTLDEKGLARVEGIEAGTCKVSFPDLDQAAWEKA